MKEKEDKLINLHSSARYNLTDKAKKERMQRFSSSAILEEVMEAIFPSSIYCISCGSITDGSRYCSICDSCIEKFLWVQEETCDICGRVLSRDGIYDTVFVDNMCLCKDCSQREHYFDRGFTCTAYGLYERKLITDFKKRGKPYLGRFIGKILHDRIVIEELDFDVIIPVPVHKKRFRERGYNQAEIMARFLSKYSGKPWNRNILFRTEATVPMKKLGAMERMDNLKNAFEVKNAHKIKEKSLLLIDDIYTTGATADICSMQLKNHGALKVYVLTFSSVR